MAVAVLASVWGIAGCLVRSVVAYRTDHSTEAPVIGTGAFS